VSNWATQDDGIPAPSFRAIVAGLVDLGIEVVAVGSELEALPKQSPARRTASTAAGDRATTSPARAAHTLPESGADVRDADLMPDLVLQERLIAVVRARPEIMAALRAVRGLRLPDWAVGAGLIRNAVWDYLHGYDEPIPTADIDVLYFDPSDLTSATEQDAERRLGRALPSARWDVKNQARVHLWYPAKFGRRIQPLRSVEDGLASWAETATAVAVRLEDDDRLTVLAPFGLGDLFGLVLRPVATWASRATAESRARNKRWLERWPLLRWVKQ
jgi:hypothetical protein